MSASASFIRSSSCHPAMNLPPYPGILEQLDNGSYAIKNTRVSNETLQALTLRPDLLITEIASPLSRVDIKVLTSFLQVHGANILKFNMQHASHLDDNSFLSIMSLMPQLRSLSLQYLHHITNKSALRVIQDHFALCSVALSSNDMLDTSLLPGILAINRTFDSVVLDLNSHSEQAVMTKLKAGCHNLKLTGLAFKQRDLNMLTQLPNLDHLTLTLTSIEAHEVAQFINSLPTSSSLQSITICANTPFLIRKFYHQLRDLISSNTHQITLENDGVSLSVRPNSSYHTC